MMLDIKKISPFRKMKEGICDTDKREEKMTNVPHINQNIHIYSIHISMKLQGVIMFKNKLQCVKVLLIAPNNFVK